MCKAVKSMYDYEVVMARVRVGGNLTEAFMCSQCLKQAQFCSPFLLTNLSMKLF